MYNPALLRSAFSGVVGLLQANIPGVPVITSPLTDSSSGIYAQDKHTLITLENLFAAAPDFNINNYQVWQGSTAYVKGFAVSYAGVLYVSLFAVNSNVPPPSDATNWALFYPFQTWLQQKFNQAVTNLFSEVVKLFKLQDMGKAIIERQQLYRGVGNMTELIIPDNSAVGFEILPQQAEALLVQIDMLGTQFTESQNLDFYLYHSSATNYLKKFTVPVGAVGSQFSWATLVDCIMMYMRQNTNGTYPFVYYESDLVSGNQAVSKRWDCGSTPCADCDGVQLNMYNRWSRYTSFRNIKVPASGLDLTNARTLPNLSTATYDSSTNWGLNFSLTVRCDLTDFIIYSKTLYADALAMQFCLELLKSIAQSSRIEPAVAQIKLQARAELNLAERSTFINQYWASVNALKIDMSGFSSSCQPCDEKKNKGKWRSV